MCMEELWRNCWRKSDQQHYTMLTGSGMSDALRSGSQQSRRREQRQDQHSVLESLSSVLGNHSYSSPVILRTQQVSPGTKKNWTNSIAKPGLSTLITASAKPRLRQLRGDNPRPEGGDSIAHRRTGVRSDRDTRTANARFTAGDRSSLTVERLMANSTESFLVRFCCYFRLHRDPYSTEDRP